MNNPTCKTCEHFYQHYSVDDQSYTVTNCGHCVFPRLKHRKPDQKCCEHYTPCQAPPSLPDRKGVVNFLTTDLLQYILSLPLPPEEG